MQRTFIFWVIVGFSSLTLGTTWGGQPNAFELRQGDRVVLVGDNLMEGEQRYGYIEYMLTTRYPKRDIVFRHLSGNTDEPIDWVTLPEPRLTRLLSELQDLNPTVVLLGYGMATASATDKSLAGFRKWLRTLLDGVREANPETRVVFLSPIRHEQGPPPSPEPKAQNQQREAYVEVVRDLADQYKAHFVDLFKLLNNSFFLNPGPPLTKDGVHLNEYGYRRAAEVIAQALEWYPPNWRVGLTEEGRLRDGAYGLQVEAYDRKEDSVRLVVLEEILVSPPWLGGEPIPPMATPSCRLQVQGIRDGIYQLSIDGQEIQSARARVLKSSGVVVQSGPQFEQASQLLEVIRKKNGFLLKRRIHEGPTGSSPAEDGQVQQAQGADSSWAKLAKEEEDRIAILRKPLRHTIELKPVVKREGDPKAVLSPGVGNE